ncbi:hypothetical protein [Aureivirga marina]|uniref:hypothetical protein n=1 Tax=Aureivirga marina TaxID=1182451 RepID=UPI0018CBA0EE|nr:hypothetical protein [Aureivirga marina]
MTEKEALEDGSYEKIYKENGIIKKIESYLNQEFWKLTYYLDKGENEKDIFKESYQQIDSVVFIDRKVPIGNFFIERERETYIYQNETKIGYRIRVYDEQDRLVCCQITHKNDTPIISSEETELVKYCYLSLARDYDNPTLTDHFLKFIYQDQKECETPFGEPLYIDWHLGNNILDEQSIIDTFDSMEEVIQKFGKKVNLNYYSHTSWNPDEK